MRWYAETPGRRSREFVADLLVAGWVVGWVVIARFVHALVSALSAPAGPMRAAGDSLERRMLDVSDRITSVPLVGDDLQRPFAATASAGTNLTAAAGELESSVDQVALWMALLTAGTPILLVLGLYLFVRVRSRRAAATLATYRDRPELQALLALRGLVNSSPAQLSAISEDPLSAWRAGDPDVVAALANLELRTGGLRPVAPSSR